MLPNLLLLGLFAAGPTQAQLDSAWEYAQSQNSQAVIVSVDGKIVFEKYANGGSPTRPQGLASGSKSFVGVLAICAIQDGYFKSLDEKISDTLQDWKSQPNKKDITVRQLLSLESGISGGPTALASANWNAYAEAASAEARIAPGERFQYGPEPFLAFGEFLTQRLKPKGLTVAQYITKRIEEPLGIRINWRKTKAGEPALPGGASMTARDWIAFGTWMINEGEWKGKQLLDRALFKQMFVPCTVNPTYGLTWWLMPDAEARLLSRRATSESTQGIPKDFYMAAGAGKQRLYVIPSLDFVAVRLGPIRTAERNAFQDSVFLRHLGIGGQ